MIHIGFKLIETETGNIIETWGGYNQTVETPPVLILPNGDQICGFKQDVDYNGYMLIEWMAEPLPPPIVDISDRQFFQQAAIQGFITNDDALQAVRTGFIPSPLQAILDTITDSTEKFNAEMILSGATEFKRNHPLTDQIGLALGMSGMDIDTFFRNAANL